MKSTIEDSIKKRISDKRQEKLDKSEGFRKRFAGAIARAGATADGKILIHYLMNECGYQQNSVQGSSVSGELLESNTMYNEGRRDLYLMLRKLQYPETLAAVEIFGVIKQLKTDDNFDDMFK